MKYNNLYRLSGFDANLLGKALQIPLKKENDEFLISILKPLIDARDSKQGYLNLHFMRDYLTFCPVCMSNAFHSLLHQFLFIHKCPFHYVPLKNSCPNCNRKVPYDLDDQYFRSPFVCICGYNFAQLDRRINTYNTLHIKDYNVYKWLNFSKSAPQLPLNSLFFLEALKSDSKYQDDDFKYDLIDLLTFSDKKGLIISAQDKINQMHSIHQKILNRTNKSGRYDLLYLRKFYLDSLDKESIYFCNQLFNSIARHLRKTVLKKHIGCINQFTRYSDDLSKNDVCPFAIAYTLWRSRLQGFKSTKHVDNYGMPPINRKHYTDNGYPIKNGHELIDEIYSKVRREERTGKRAVFHWKMNRFVGEYILADFKRCLTAANDFFNGNKFNWGYIDSFDYLAKVMIKPPIELDEKYFLYLRSTRTISSLSMELNCPNNTVIKRRGPKKIYCKSSLYPRCPFAH